jgi:hypothetical protein
MVQSGSPAEQAILKAFTDINPTAYRDPSNDPVAINAPPGYDWLVRYQASAEIINKAMWNSVQTTDNGIAPNPNPIDANAASLPSPALYQPMQDVLLSLKSPIDMTVTRALPSYHPMMAWAQAVDVGTTYVGMGFDSTSYNPDVVVNGQSLQLRMRVPAGSRGAMLNAIYPNNYTQEQEWLMPANSRWVVTGKEMIDGKLQVYMDLIDQRNLDGSLVYP